MNNKQNEISCPACGAVVSIAAALSADIEARYEKDFQAKSGQMQLELKQRTEALEKEKRALEDKKDHLQKEIESKILVEKQLLERQLREQLQKASHVEIEDLKQQVSEREQKLKIATTNELELRKKTRELEEKEKDLELEVQRKIDHERSRLSEEVAKRVSEDYRQKGLEKDKQLDDMRKQIEDLKRKSELGSQQNQGEVLELEIESLLKVLFPLDTIEPVAKGMRGADVMQKVMTSTGQLAGSIVWETKQTKTWSDGWIEKLKEDQRTVTAEFAIIVSAVLPKGINHLGQMDGVWIADLATVPGLAHALRSQVIQLFHTRNLTSGKGEKMEYLYEYLTGTHFRQRVEAIVDSFTGLKEDLEKEKRSIQKAWAAREQQLTRVLSSTVGMYGDIQGIVGASLPKIASLEFETPEAS